MAPSYTEGTGRPGEIKRANFKTGNFSTKLHQATTHIATSAFDHRDVHTLYFLILLSLAGPTASISPTALAFLSLSRHTVKKTVHIQDAVESPYHHLPTAADKRLVRGDRNTGLRKNWNIRTLFQVCSYVLVQRTLDNLPTASIQVLSLSLHCYYRGLFPLIITFLRWQRADFLHCWCCCFRIPPPGLNTLDRLSSPQGCQDWYGYLLCISAAYSITA